MPDATLRRSSFHFFGLLVAVSCLLLPVRVCSVSLGHSESLDNSSDLCEVRSPKPGVAGSTPVAPAKIQRWIEVRNPKIESLVVEPAPLESFSAMRYNTLSFLDDFNNRLKIR